MSSAANSEVGTQDLRNHVVDAILPWGRLVSRALAFEPPHMNRHFTAVGLLADCGIGSWCFLNKLKVRTSSCR